MKMPINLHERFSEFSYGYGVTSEVERLLQNLGLRTVPFLPSLIVEKKVGYDVRFDRPGVALMLQFKLGEELERFRRTHPGQTVPILARPFWRFWIDTAEIEGQYTTLLNAERSGAEVYYVAPRFATWQGYVSAYEKQTVLEGSTLITPSSIERDLRFRGEPDGPHRIIYDQSSVHVCSDPSRIQGVQPQELGQSIMSRIEQHDDSVSSALLAVYNGLDTPREVVPRPEPFQQGQSAPPQPDAFVELRARRTAERIRRFDELRLRFGDSDYARFTTVGVEAWALGSQLIIAYPPGEGRLGLMLFPP